MRWGDAHEVSMAYRRPYSRRSLRHDLREAEMSRLRLLANLAAGVILVAILCGIMAVIIDERASKHVSDPIKPFAQEVKFK